MSEQEDFHRPEKPLEKTTEIGNEARISKNTEMSRKFNTIPPQVFSCEYCERLKNIYERLLWKFNENVFDHEIVSFEKCISCALALTHLSLD